MWCGPALEMRDKCFKSRFVSAAGICSLFVAFTLFCLDMNSLTQHTFCVFIRSSSDTTSHIKPSPLGCMALNLWWGPSKGCLIRRCLSTKPGSTHCSAQTDHHTSPFSLWVRPSVFTLDSVGSLWGTFALSVCKGNPSHHTDFYLSFFRSAGCSSPVAEWRRNKGRDLWTVKRLAVSCSRCH